MQTLETAIDWKSGFKLNLSTWSSFVIEKYRRTTPEQLTELALRSCIYHEGRYVMTQDLVELVSKSITWNAQIFEAWNYGFASDIHSICAKLSQPDAEILLHASGFANVSLADLYSASEEAVHDALQELYGEEEEFGEDC